MTQMNLTRIEDQTGIISLNDPPRLNALTEESFSSKQSIIAATLKIMEWEMLQPLLMSLPQLEQPPSKSQQQLQMLASLQSFHQR
jgi:hypothetical protein